MKITGYREQYTLMTTIHYNSHTQLTKTCPCSIGIIDASSSFNTAEHFHSQFTSILFNSLLVLQFFVLIYCSLS